MLRHLPNAITVARMLACVPLVWVILDGRPGAALWLALAVGISDVLDGFLARRFGWQSRLGGLLDPLADKLFLVSAFVALAVIGAMPMWLLLLVLFRDLLIVGGAFAYHRLVEPVPAAPTLLGKLSTMAQVLLVLVLLATDAGLGLPPQAADVLVIAVAVLALVSGGQYVWVWTARARDHWRSHRT